MYTLWAEAEFIENGILNAWVMFVTQSAPARVKVLFCDTFTFVYRQHYPLPGQPGVPPEGRLAAAESELEVYHVR